MLVKVDTSRCVHVYSTPPTFSTPIAHAQAAKDEFSRAVVGKGTVVRYMRDGSTQMLFVTGLEQQNQLVRRTNTMLLASEGGVRTGSHVIL